MLSRRDFLQVTAATAALVGAGGLVGRAAAHQRITQESLLEFEPLGQVTLLNFTDIHGQLMPLYFREPSCQAMLKHFGLKAGSAEAYAFSNVDFTALAKDYGRIGGLAHMATLIKAIRAERPDNTILVDNGDTWQGSYGSLKTRGDDMVAAMNALGVDLMTAHWEFTYGEDRVLELIEKLDFPFLAGNVKDVEWEEAVFDSTATFERGGVKVAIIGQAFPYTPIANPRYLIPNWSFGISEDRVRGHVKAARDAGADLIVLASHNGFDVDRKLATRVQGIDVILTGHTHDAIPGVIGVGDTLLIATGSHGKFLGRLDLKVENKKVVDHRFRLIPVFSDAIAPDPAIAAVVKKLRAPFAAELGRVLGKTETLLYRRGNFNGTFDDLICQAIMEEREAQIAFSPGFRWGASVLPGGDIRVEDVYNQTAITYAACTRNELTGEFIKVILEDVGDNLFNPDPYYQQGGDMVRVGGMGYTIDIAKPMGERVSDMTLLSTGERIDPAKTYVVGGWASVNEGAEGPMIYDLVSRYVERKKVVRVEENRDIRVLGA
jgi:sulfur-oxidizing protein SoxB